MSAQWTFFLTDGAGNNLAELSTAANRTVAFKRNTYAEVQLTLSHEDDAASLLLATLRSTSVPKLKGYRRGPSTPGASPAPLCFRGPLAATSEQSDEASTLTVTFRSPFSVLVGDGDKLGRYCQTAVSYAATDAGLIGKGLIDIANTDAPTGLATDPTLVQTTKPRDRTYTVGQNIGSAITDLTAVLDGFDFYEAFVDGAGATDAYFNVAASMGNPQPNARFEYGRGTLANVASLSRTTQPPMNCILATGANGLISTYSDSTSVATYGKWWGKFDFSTIADQAMLDDKAKALCRPLPVKTVAFTPDLGVSPLPFDDWNLGDTVPFFASRVGLYENTSLRVNGFTIPIDDNGYESMQTPDTTSPSEDAYTRAQLVAEVVS